MSPSRFLQKGGEAGGSSFVPQKWGYPGMGEVSAPDQDIRLQMSARPSLVHLLRVRGQGILPQTTKKIICPR